VKLNLSSESNPRNRAWSGTDARPGADAPPVLLSLVAQTVRAPLRQQGCPANRNPGALLDTEEVP
jgi:hypothetical protein